MTLGQRRPVLQAPAIQALFILCAALILALLVGQAFEWLFGVAIPPIPFAFLHGALAAGIAYLRRMASWWAPILFFFPPAAMLVNSFHLPPMLFLAVFLFLLLLFWSTFRSQVPFYPSGRSTWDAVVALLPSDQPLRVIDIGSGLGGAVLYLSKLRADSRFTGIDFSTEGIGAARNWIKAQFDEYSRDAGGRLVVAFDAFHQPPTPPRIPAGGDGRRRAADHVRAGDCHLHCRPCHHVEVMS